MSVVLDDPFRPLLDVTVVGIPAPQGSKNRWGGEDNPRTAPWRATLAAAAQMELGDRVPYAGPLSVEVLFRFPRPKAHYGTGRNAEVLKASAPNVHATKPDLDKLLRAIGDALAGIVWRDDSQIVEFSARKVYGAPSARVRVWEVLP